MMPKMAVCVRMHVQELVAQKCVGGHCNYLLCSRGACPEPLHFSLPQDQVVVIWDVPPSLRIREHVCVCGGVAGPL